MPLRRNVLTPEALAMVDAIARSGSFAGAARELGKVPSALTYSVRQLEDALDVLLFDRSARQAQLTDAGRELLSEGRRLLRELDSVANRVRRVASGWEAQLSISVDTSLSWPTVLELAEAFSGHCARAPASGTNTTRLRLESDVLAGTWEALLSGRCDLALGVMDRPPSEGAVEMAPLGVLRFVYCMVPEHPLAQGPADAPLTADQLVQHRAVAVADSAFRVAPVTVNLLAGQDVLTVPTMDLKRDAILRGLGSGFLPEPMARPHLAAGRLVERSTWQGPNDATLFYAWRPERDGLRPGLALQWWLSQLSSPATRTALLGGA